ncbi:MAG: sulfurtransferase [Burkholderiaceae bacterium]
MPHTLLVDTDTLAAHLDDPLWVLVDCRSDPADPEFGRTAYRAGHLPGAIFLDLDGELCGEHTGHNGRHPLPDPQRLLEVLGAAGIGPDTQVVVYDDRGGASAARLWWMLRWLGHEAVAVLDGGLPRWEADGRPLVTEVPVRRPASLTGRARDLMRVDTGFVLAGLDDPGLLLVDARVAPRYRGELEPIDPVAGRIPGAVNRPAPDNLAPDGRFRPAAELKAGFEKLMADAGARAGSEPLAPQQLVHYCGSGIAACHNLLAMEIAGLPGARLYPGSWSEWIADPARPVERG